MANDWCDVELRLTQTVPPVIRPVGLDEIKRQILVTNPDDDALLNGYIDAATQLTERVIQWRTLLTTTWQLKLDAFPAGELRLPLPPLQSVSSIAYVDSNGDSQTLSSSAYTVDTTSEPGRVYPAYGTSWPSTLAHPNSVTVTFVAGYTSRDRVPATTRTGIAQLVSNWFENREPVVTGTIATKIPLHAEVLLNVESLRAMA